MAILSKPPRCCMQLVLGSSLMMTLGAVDSVIWTVEPKNNIDSDSKLQFCLPWACQPKKYKNIAIYKIVHQISTWSTNCSHLKTLQGRCEGRGGSLGRCMTVPVEVGGGGGGGRALLPLGHWPHRAHLRLAWPQLTQQRAPSRSPIENPPCVSGAWCHLRSVLLFKVIVSTTSTYCNCGNLCGVWEGALSTLTRSTPFLLISAFHGPIWLSSSIFPCLLFVPLW